MNRVFYIFRHGETDWNREKRCQGHTNTILNKQGIQQAEELALKMLDFHMDIIVSSDLSRAMSTGAMVAGKKGIAMSIDPRLREMSYGEAEGMLYDEAIALYGEEIWAKLQCFKRENDHVGFPCGETRKISRERFHEVLIELLEKTTYQAIGISTHGGVLRNILHSFLPENHSILPIPNCVVYKCEYLKEEKLFVVDPNPL
jgi:broad specificity phosphatase PhoE